MFGFGRPAREKALIASITLQLRGAGIEEGPAKAAATNLVDEVLTTCKSQGVDPFCETQGDRYATDPAYTAPRLAAGLTIEDIRSHWNRPLLLIGVEEKMRMLVNFLILDVTRQQGGDVRAASDRFKKTSARYGDPAKFDPADRYNEGLRPEDADIYVEFARRVDAWRGRNSEAQMGQVIQQFGSLNAAVRAMVANKLL